MIQPKKLFRQLTPRTIKNSRTLRKNLTDAEKKLWYILRNRQVHGLHFRRQHPIEPYIVNFVCLTHKLVIELDGGQHSLSSAYDNKRDDYLRSKGFKVLRFWNNDVMENMEGIYTTITDALRPPPQPSPFQGEGAEDKGAHI